MNNFKSFLFEFYKTEFLEAADKIRKDRAKKVNIKFEKLNFKKKIAFFNVNSPQSKKNWIVELQFLEIKEISKSKKTELKELVEMAIEAGNLNIFCNCPDFKFKGYKYISNELEYNIDGKKYEEGREPKIKNPKQEGTLCKHAIAVLDRINEYIEPISEAIIANRKKGDKDV